MTLMMMWIWNDPNDDVNMDDPNDDVNMEWP